MKRIIVCLCLALHGLKADESAKLLDSLRSELAKFAKTSSKGKEDATELRIRRIGADDFVSQAPKGDALTEDNIPSVLLRVEQLRVQGYPDSIAELSISLASELRNKMLAKRKEFNEKFNSVVKAALEAGLDAKNAAELDAPQQEVARMQKAMGTMGYEGMSYDDPSSETLQAVQKILSSIQDALIAFNRLKSLPKGGAPQLVQSLTGFYGTRLFAIMPRSEYLTKVQALGSRLSPDRKWTVLTQSELEARVDKLVRGVKKAADIEGALHQLEALDARQHELGGTGVDSNVINQLRDHWKTYNEFLTGAATSLSSVGRYTFSDDHETSISEVKWILAKFAITRVLQVPETQGPAESENMAEYIRRMIEVAGKNADWALMQRILNAAKSLEMGGVATVADSDALRQLIAGQNLEKAKEYAPAVTAYLGALKSGSLCVPADKIGELLDAIKREHRPEYDAGLRVLSESPEDPYGRFFPGMRPANFDPLAGISKEGGKLEIPALKKESQESKDKANGSLPSGSPPSPTTPESKPK